MVAADDIAVRGQQGARADAHVARREHFAVEPDVHAIVEGDIAALARQDAVAADEHAAADRDAALRSPLASRRQLSSITTLSPMRILCGWRSTTCWPNTTFRPQAPSSRGYSTFRRTQPHGARARLRDHHDQLVPHQRTDTRPSDDERLYFSGRHPAETARPARAKSRASRARAPSGAPPVADR